MGPKGFNITEICRRDPTTLNDEEFNIALEHCESPFPDVPTGSSSTSSFPSSSSSDSPPILGYTYFYTFLIFGGILLNLLVMITIFSRNRLRTVPNAFMVSLSVADFLMTTVALPLRIMERIDENKNHVITSLLFPCIGVASIFSLCCVTLDRYMHIKQPLNYEKYINKRRAIAIVTGVWFFSISQSLVFFLVKNNRHHEAIFNDVRIFYCFAIPSIFIVAAYAKLFLIARSHARVIAATSVRTPDRPWSQKKDFKILKNIALIVGTFILCWFPFLFAVSYELHHSTLTREFYVLMGILECFACSTCVLNLIIYGILRRDLRISMKYVAGCKRGSMEESE
ncbi:trace amine-associated receptor 9-like [Dendronephthya gigantea]|uniref:trace amine-associated receptor 9-like n=1 Tax=Dendronephthya gigantea TaxID=151771 RepID=UPI00106B554F|nr:trace amine-associated receptor 9-like [Dendronephthya gigantea]